MTRCSGSSTAAARARPSISVFPPAPAILSSFPTSTPLSIEAFAELLGYFADPRVGAVSGSLGVRNASASLITRHQAIEYAIGIALGRIVQDRLEFFRSCRMLLVRSAVLHLNKSVDKTLK